MRLHTLLACFVLGVVVANPVEAWNAAGHKTTAAIAWQKLSPNVRRQVVDAIRMHPRFSEDFEQELDSELHSASEAEKDRWIFCQASIWPDIARGLPAGERAKYHRPRWHYINIPVFLNEEQAQHFSGNLPANTSLEFPSILPDEELNGVQALKRAIHVITDSSSSDEERALSYCWLIHVIGDLHQPLHAASLFTVEVFPRGDKGGNAIEVRTGQRGGSQNLHSKWDSLLGSSANINGILRKATSLISEHPSEFGTAFVALPDDAWSTETVQLALQHAYDPLLSDIQDAEESGRDLERVTLDESYLKSAGSLSRRQAVICGARLAAVLESIAFVRAPRPATERVRALGFPAAIASPESARPSEARLARAPRRPAGGDYELMRRIQSLELEVAELRDEIRSMKDTKPRASFGADSTQRLDEEAEDDGEQCSCGAE